MLNSVTTGSSPIDQFYNLVTIKVIWVMYILTILFYLQNHGKIFQEHFECIPNDFNFSTQISLVFQEF
jgi:hypothetical protein